MIGKPPLERLSVDGTVAAAGIYDLAELAASGQTNRQIADGLFLTVKSVEWHLGNVYRKLDIRGRRELGAALNPGGESRGSP